MKRIILFTFFLTSLCVHSFGKDKFESPNHQLSAEVNGQSAVLKPIPQMSSANLYGLPFTVSMLSFPYWR